jgi:hypothetical protein
LLVVGGLGDRATEMRFGGLNVAGDAGTRVNDDLAIDVETPVTITLKKSPPATRPLTGILLTRQSKGVDEPSRKAEGAISSSAAWPRDGKSMAAIINFIILTNLDNLAIVIFRL